MANGCVTSEDSCCCPKQEELGCHSCWGIRIINISRCISVAGLTMKNDDNVHQFCIFVIAAACCSAAVSFLNHIHITTFLQLETMICCTAI